MAATRHIATARGLFGRQDSAMHGWSAVGLLASSLACVACASTGRTEVALRQMVDAEVAFSRTNMAEGQRAAWLRWFAPEGIMFRPFADRAHVVMRGDPQPPPAPPGAFEWRPTYADVSASVDLGYNSGPVRVIGAARADRQFFSIWRPVAAGEWRVIVDLGTPVATAVAEPFDAPFVVARPRPRVVRGGHPRPDAIESRGALTSIAYADLLDTDARGLRWQALPLVGIGDHRAYLESHPAAVTYSVEGYGLSRAGDMAFTYGRYVAADATRTRGAYARVWRPDDGGRWRVVFDVLRPAPAS